MLYVKEQQLIPFASHCVGNCPKEEIGIAT